VAWTLISSATAILNSTRQYAHLQTEITLHTSWGRLCNGPNHQKSML
jgi:hypothetical protein